MKKLFLISLTLTCMLSFYCVSFAQTPGQSPGATIEKLKLRLQSEPDSCGVCLALGVAYLDSGDFNNAQNCLEKALSLCPGSVPAHYTLAMLFETKKDLSAAVREWNEVLRLSDNRELKALADKHIKQLEAVR